MHFVSHHTQTYFTVTHLPQTQTRFTKILSVELILHYPIQGYLTLYRKSTRILLCG